jgi:hypothetical protein
MFLSQSLIYFVSEADIFTSCFLEILFISFTAICNSSSDFAIVTWSPAYSIVMGFKELI